MVMQYNRAPFGGYGKKRILGKIKTAEINRSTIAIATEIILMKAGCFHNKPVEKKTKEEDVKQKDSTAIPPIDTRLKSWREQK